MAKKLILLFLLVSSGLFSQTKDGSKKSTKEMLQGKWVAAENNGIMKYEFNDKQLFIIKGDSVIFTCNDYELKNKSIDTHCPGKEKLIFKIQKVTDSTLFIRSMSSDYYHKYNRVVRK